MSRFPTVAIVGSGPSGCYVAQALQKKWPGVQITILEALPAPYGLVRYGIAADHQGSKSVIQQFDRVLSRGGTQFVGNVSVGRDISYEKLVAAFDIVVLAIGLDSDARLNIELNGQPPLCGAGRLLKYLNGHPQAKPLVSQDGRVRRLGTDICVIGAGNVAIDIVRLVLKSDAELVGSDVSDDSRVMLGTSEVRRITVLSRAKVTDAKCDLSMMEELLALPGLSVSVHGVGEEEKGDIAEALMISAKSSRSHRDKEVFLDFVFDATPVKVNQLGNSAEVFVVNKDHIETSFRVDTVVTAIGFDNSAVDSELLPPALMYQPGVYKVGWYSRGPRGTVAENRKDAKAIAETIVSEFDSGLIAARKIGYESIKNDLPITLVTYSGWKRIDSYEVATADSDRSRKKVTDKGLMLGLAHDVEKREYSVSMPALIA